MPAPPRHPRHGDAARRRYRSARRRSHDPRHGDRERTSNPARPTHHAIQARRTPMNETNGKVTTIVTKFAKNRAALADVTPDTRFREDLDISSASLIDIVLDLEDTFSLTIDDDELKQITTVGAAVELIEAKQK